MNKRFRYCRILVAFIALLSVQDATLRADDWPVARGDNQGTGIAKTAVSENIDVLWTYKATTDAGFDATAVIQDGIVYVGDTAGTFHAIRLADGSPVWAKSFPDLGFAAGAAVDGDRLFVGDLEGVVRCLSTADGRELWSYKLEGEVFAGPTPHNNSVLFTSEVGSLVCLNKADGKELWKPFRIDAPLRCSPTIASGHVMLAGCDSLLHVIDAATGIQANIVEIDGPTGSTPAIVGERVYFGTEGGSFFAIDVPTDAAKKPAVAWKFHDKRRGQPIRSAAAVTDSLAIFGSQGKAIFAIDTKTGDQRWIVPTRSRVESSPVIAGKLAIAATSAGKLYLLDVATGDIKYENDFGGGFTASPAVVNGKVILGNTDGTLYCLGANDTPTNDASKAAPDAK